MTGSCGCRIDFRDSYAQFYEKGAAIIYCPLHAAAEEMLALVRDCIDYMEHNSSNCSEAETQLVIRASNLTDRIARAEGRT